MAPPRFVRLLNPVAICRHLWTSVRLGPSMRRVACNWPIWMVRQLLLPLLRLRIVVATRAGTRFHLGSDRVDDAILRHLYDSGRSLYFPTTFAPIDASPLILDVGAHHGMYAVEVLRRNPGARLVAVEPNPAGCRQLRANLEANGLMDRVEIVEAALGGHSGQAFLEFSSEGSWGDCTIPVPSGAPAGRGLLVPVIAVAEALQSHTPQLVKLNAEGAEFEVLPAMFGEGIFPRYIVLMTHPHVASVPDLIELVRRNGYHVTDADDPPRRARFHCSRDLPPGAGTTDRG